MKSSTIFIILIWLAIFIINIVLKNARNKKNAQNQNKDIDEARDSDSEYEDYDAAKKLRQMLEGRKEEDTYIEEIEEHEEEAAVQEDGSHTMMAQKYSTQDDEEDSVDKSYIESMKKIAQYENIVTNQEKEIERLGALVDAYKIKEDGLSLDTYNIDMSSEEEAKSILGTEEMMKNAIIYNAILERRGGKI